MQRYYILITVILLILFVVEKKAYAVHKGAGALVCGACHIMHNSQGGTSLEGNVGGSMILLRGKVTTRNDISKFCLQCHGKDGTFNGDAHQPHGERPPTVHGGSSLNWDDSKPFGEIGAGGDFFKELDTSFSLSTDGAVVALGYGHSVGITDALPPGHTSSVTMDLECTTCHSHHGTDVDPYPYVMKPNKYRNLWVMKTTGDFSDCLLCHDAPNDFRGSGYLNEMKTWVGGSTGKYAEVGSNYTPVIVNGVSIWPVYKGDPTVAANNNVYDGILGTGDSLDGGMAGWCARCHHSFHEMRDVSNVEGEDWRRHPINKIIVEAEVSGTGVDTIDYAHYTSIEDGYKVPTAFAGDTADISTQTYYAKDEGKYKVFCLSCHFAHAGPYRDSLRWDYLESVGSGEQVANAIDSITGCQQCHNR